MKKIKRIVSAAFILMISFHAVKAQDFGDILQAGTADAQLYLQEYADPIMASFTNGLGAGWYNTAKPHKLLGFDLTVGINIANIPTNERTFNFNDVSWNNLQLRTGSSNTFPTAVGGETSNGVVIPANIPIDLGNGQTITYSENIEFDAPNGADLESLPVVGFPVPTVQLGIGLPKNTDLKIRYIGANLEDASINLIGIGVMHDLKQWIPGFKQLPFDASGFIGWTRLNADFDFNETSADFSANGVTELSASSFTLQGVVSKKLAIFTPYVGVGFMIGSSSLDVKGDFTYTNTTTGESESVTDPIALEFDGGSSPRLNFGLRMKLLILTIHGEYAIQKYNTLTLGVGLSIR